jgi:hypothetical protein
LDPTPTDGAREGARESGIPIESELGKPDDGDLVSSAGGHALIAMTKATLHTMYLCIVIRRSNERIGD